MAPTQMQRWLPIKRVWFPATVCRFLKALLFLVRQVQTQHSYTLIRVRPPKLKAERLILQHLLLISMPISGSVIQYFVVAQDISVNQNVGINSGTFTATPTDVNLVGAFPITGTINSYSIINVSAGGATSTNVSSICGTTTATLSIPAGIQA